MRIVAAIVAVILGASLAHAEGDAKASFGPITAAKSAKAKPKAKAARRAKPAAETPKAKSAGKEEPAPPKGKAKAANQDGSAASKTKSKSAAAPAAPATTGSVTAGAPKTKPSGLRESYLAIPLADRLAIQSGLSWAGDYSGPIDGEFSDRLVDAMKAYQKRHKSKVTGLLSPDERATIAAAARPKQEEVGWRLVEDPVTGARVGLPGKLATRTTPAHPARAGVRSRANCRSKPSASTPVRRWTPCSNSRRSSRGAE